MSQFFAWTPDDEPGTLLSVADEDGWDAIRQSYAPNRTNDPLEQIIKIAKQWCVKSVVIERRYIDLDYRSEHSRFYSTTFLRYPSVCHRGSSHLTCGPPWSGHGLATRCVQRMEAQLLTEFDG